MSTTTADSPLSPPSEPIAAARPRVFRVKPKPLFVLQCISIAAVTLAAVRLLFFDIESVTFTPLFVAMLALCITLTILEGRHARGYGALLTVALPFALAFYLAAFVQCLLGAMEFTLHWHDWLPNFLYVPAGFLSEQLSWWDGSADGGLGRQVYPLAWGDGTLGGRLPSVNQANTLINILILLPLAPLMLKGLRRIYRANPLSPGRSTEAPSGVGEKHKPGEHIKAVEHAEALKPTETNEKI